MGSGWETPRQGRSVNHLNRYAQVAALMASVWIIWFGTRGWEGIVSYLLLVPMVTLGFLVVLGARR